MNKNWRLILDGKNDGYYNMAVDEAILESYSSQKIPTLRIYGWNSPFITLGFNQDCRKVLNCAQVPFTRRITGGSAIFHNREVTYSLVCSLEDLALPKQVKGSYRALCLFLKVFYRSLGLKAEFARDVLHDKLGSYGNFCFSSCQHFDLLIEGKKIGGNAQRRKRDIIFQQGSIPQEVDFSEIEKTINGALNLQASVASLNGILKKETDFYSLQDLLRDSFMKAFGVNLIKGGLCPEEKQACSSLMEGKYKSESWKVYRNNKQLQSV